MKPNYFTVALLALLSVGKLNAQITPANNKIAVDVSTYHVQNPAYNYDSSFVIGTDLGMNEVGLFINWSMLEIAPNSFDFTILDIADDYYPAHAISVDLNLNPINTNQLEVPSDLDSLNFDDPLFINRYNILLDSVKAHIPSISLSSFVIGSEIGAYLGSDSIKWAQYTTFYDSVLVHAKSLWPGLKVAVELQFTDFITYTTYAQNINSNSDYIGVSYYPLWSNFTVKPLITIPFDMDTLVSMFPSKPICFYQYGYPSSPSCSSSDSLQAEFISETFTYWDFYASNIRLIDFTWMHDLDTTAVNFYETYYGVSDTAFLEFLRTIGLREWNGNGVDKPALNELRCQAQQRGYNSLSFNCTTGITDPISNKNNFIFIFPNPTQDEFNIELSVDFENSEIKIYNQLGQIQKHVSNINSKIISIEIADLPNGVYFISLNNRNKPITAKFIINR